MSISQDLRFHIIDIDTPDEALEKLKKNFGIQNQIMTHQLENELLTLNPNNFSSIEYFLSKFKSLRILLEVCKVKKEDGSLIYCILSKLGPAYSIFVFAFHSTRESTISYGTTYKYPCFDSFCDSLIREQEKILHLGLINCWTPNPLWVGVEVEQSKRSPSDLGMWNSRVTTLYYKYTSC